MRIIHYRENIGHEKETTKHLRIIGAAAGHRVETMVAARPLGCASLLYTRYYVAGYVFVP